MDSTISVKIRDFLELVGTTTKDANGLETFAALHYYAIDALTAFFYGTKNLGVTTALQGTPEHMALLNDIVDPARRGLPWLSVHLPSLVTWMHTRNGVVGHIVKPLLPIARPVTYTGIRACVTSYADLPRC
jgi:hypothetical protein